MKHCFVRQQHKLHKVGRLFNLVKNCLLKFVSLGDACWLQLLDNLRMVTIQQIKHQEQNDISKHAATLHRNCLGFTIYNGQWSQLGQQSVFRRGISFYGVQSSFSWHVLFLSPSGLVELRTFHTLYKGFCELALGCYVRLPKDAGFTFFGKNLQSLPWSFCSMIIWEVIPYF